MIAPRWARGANMRKPACSLPLRRCYGDFLFFSPLTRDLLFYFYLQVP
jgi:hypothetical protein